LGFAFKKNTGDTRESAAIYVAKQLLEEQAELSIYDPKVPKEAILRDLKNVVQYQLVDDFVTVHDSLYDAAKGAHALVIMTEWDEFKVLNYERLYEEMKKPAYIFDGRIILDKNKLEQVGFKVFTIGSQARSPSDSFL